MTDGELVRKRLGLVLACLALIATAALLWCQCQIGDRVECVKHVADDRWQFVAVAAIWTIGPPIWFLVEYTVLYGKDDTETAFEKFKHQQQLAAAVWLGLMAFLAAAWTIVAD